jgi:hypothetical protein
MTDQEIRAKALESAIATYQMLPETRREDAIKKGVAGGKEVHQQIENLANLYLKYISP